MNEGKKLFYVWFLGAKECRGLRGEEYVRPIVRHLKEKAHECEPPKVTLQISPKGIKLVADSFKHFVPSHAVTYVSQGKPPEDDIVSVILLLYNPITKCPVHLHSYRCDSVETADFFREQLQILIDMPENQRKIRDLEDRLHSQGLYPSFKNDSRLLKSCDTGIGGSSADLLTNSDSEDDDHQSDPSTQGAERVAHLNKKAVVPNSVSKSEQERIARLYDSLAAELRDKLSGVLTGHAAPILLPPKDYDVKPRSKVPIQDRSSTNIRTDYRTSRQQARTLQRNTDNGSSSGLSSGIGSDYDEQLVHERSKPRSFLQVRSLSCQDNHQSGTLQRQRSSYHESSHNNSNALVSGKRDSLLRQSSECRDLNREKRKSMTDLRKRDEMSPRIDDYRMIRRQEESVVHRDVNKRNVDYDKLIDPNQGRVKEALSKFEMKHVDSKGSNSRSRSFHDEHPPTRLNGNKYRRVAYQELNDKERFPGLDRDTARIEHHVGGESFNQRHLQRHQSAELINISGKFADSHSGSVPVTVEPLGNRHFRAVRQPLALEQKNQGLLRR